MNRSVSLFGIASFAFLGLCLAQCSLGTVPECLEDSDCTERADQYCELSVHKCMPRTCTPDCSGRECGLDPQHCGTSCGTCKLPDQQCDPTTGRCRACNPDCGARVCGPVPNGCGASCGSCKTPEVCLVSSGQCEGCALDCGVRVCGPVPNGCGESCGNCKDTESCDVAEGLCETRPAGKLVFDGSFKSTDIRTGVNDDFGAWNYSCLPRSNSLEVLPATRRPGKYMGKFTVRDGDACNSSVGAERAQLSSWSSFHPSAALGNEFWYGFSQMLDPTWTTNGEKVWNVLFGLVSLKYTTANASPGEIQLNMATSIDAANRNLHIQLNPTIIKGNYTESVEVLPTLGLGVWHDFLLHVKWTQNTTGFIELYHREEGKGEYALLFSRNNIQTKKIIPNYPDDVIDLRNGLYRSAEATTTQILYTMEYKIGTTREDVEYR